MNSRRLATAGLGLVAVLAFAVAGCAKESTSPTDGNKPASGAPAKQDDAAAALAGAAAKLSETSFKTKMTIGDTGTMNGEMDPQKEAARFTLKVSAEGQKLTIETLVVGGETFIKMKMPGSPLPGFDGKKWMRVDPDKANPAAASSFDAAKLAETLKHAGKVEKVGDNRFKGTMDLTKASEAVGQKKETLDALGDKAKAIPFEAEVDAEGRLTRYKIDMPAIGGQPAQPLDVTYSDFGTPVEVQAPPASKVIDAPGA